MACAHYLSTWEAEARSIVQSQTFDYMGKTPFQKTKQNKMEKKKKTLGSMI
jgi:hypothetical protein